MRQRNRHLTHAAIIGALYVVLTHMQNILIPNSASFAIQCRLSEALCVLAFFTPATIPGLTVGCLVFNITFAAALPLDWILGSLATLAATSAMWSLRRVLVGGYPLLGMMMPAISNAVLVGWELSAYIGGGFWLNALYVAIGELIVLLAAGTVVYRVMRRRRLDVLLFG